MPGMYTHSADHRQKVSQRFKKSPHHFRVPSSSDQTSRVLCSELTEFLSAQWQAIPLSPVNQSVSFPAPLHPHSLPDNALSTLWCYLLLQIAIIPSALQRIFSLLHNHHHPTSLSWCVSLSFSLLLYVDRWVTALLNVRLSDRGHTGYWRMPGDKRWLHVPTTSARWSWQWVCVMRGDHWFLPVTFTLQQWSSAGKGHKRVSSSLMHTAETFCLCVATSAIHEFDKMKQTL